MLINAVNFTGNLPTLHVSSLKFHKLQRPLNTREEKMESIVHSTLATKIVNLCD